MYVYYIPITISHWCMHTTLSWGEPDKFSLLEWELIPAKDACLYTACKPVVGIRLAWDSAYLRECEVKLVVGVIRVGDFE